MKKIIIRNNIKKKKLTKDMKEKMKENKEY